MTKSQSLLAVLVGVYCCTSAFAQYSRMNEIVDKVKEQGRVLDDLKSGKPREGAKIYNAARLLKEACESGQKSLADFGTSLSAAATSPFEDQLREPARQSNRMAIMFKDMSERSESLMKAINEDDVGGTKALGLMIELKSQTLDRVKDWDELRKKSDETMRFLRERQQNFLTIRDDFGKSGTNLDEVKKGLETRLRSSGMEIQKAFENWRSSYDRELEASRRYYDAFAEYNAARGASPSSSSSSNMKSAWEKWVASQRNHREAGRVVHESLTNVENIIRDTKGRMVDMARFMSDLEKFQESANPELVGKRIYEFDQWIKLFERDLSR